MQLRDVKPSETFVRVPRSLLTRFALRTNAPELQPFLSIAHLFREFRHTAWRLETRRGYASDRRSPKWARWQAGEDIAAEPANTWRKNVVEQTAAGKRFVLASAPGNVAAGEDIRNLPRARAGQRGASSAVSPMTSKPCGGRPGRRGR
ncbi:DUF6879 family protein [Streptomyces sp. 1222.5]|uniref:DUF6879 family protein n=1 Tax=Streptomyces sp. 1222.5 TaxID=1881026 RepID=UPI003EBB4DB7